MIHLSGQWRISREFDRGISLRNILRLFAAGFLYCCFAFQPCGVCAADGPVLRVGDTLPGSVLADLKGRKMRLPGDVRGKVAIIHFWAVGCSSCKKEMQDLESLYSRYRERGVVVVAIHVGQTKDTVETFLKNNGVSYFVLLDLDRRIAGQYHVAAVPQTYFLDRNGIIRYKIIGESAKEKLGKLLQNLL